MSYRQYPRNERARADAVAGHRYRWPRNDLSRRDGLLQSGDLEFENLGGVNFNPFSIDEITVSSAGFAVNFDITDFDEKWSTLLGADNAISSTFLAGISSNGLFANYTAITRVSDKRVTLTAAAVESAHVTGVYSLSATLPANAFQNRQTAMSAAAFAMLHPVATAISSPGTAIAESSVVAGGSVLDLYIVGSDGWNWPFLATSLGAGAFLLGINSWGIPLVVGNISSVDEVHLRVTLPAHAGFTIAADQKISWAIPRSAFLYRKAAFTVNTVAVLTNGA